jgi:hypothetical protein
VVFKEILIQSTKKKTQALILLACKTNKKNPQFSQIISFCSHKGVGVGVGGSGGQCFKFTLGKCSFD